MQCPAGLEWNDAMGYCDWPSSAACVPRDRPAPTPVALLSEPKGCRSSCEAGESGWVQSCKSCSHYAVCNWGTLVEDEDMVCAEGTYWDDTYKTCVWTSSTCE